MEAIETAGTPWARTMTREGRSSFRAGFERVFQTEFKRVYRVIERESGDAELAADLAQEAFVRLFKRGSLPDSPPAWLVSVAMNLFRNAKTGQARRRRLLTPWRGRAAHADPMRAPDENAAGAEATAQVRSALSGLTERDRRMLLLSAEGYRYSEIAEVLELNEASVGTLLARARRAFLQAWEEGRDAP